MVFMEPIIEAKNLWFSYYKDWILKGINLKIYEGEVVSLIGPNGCGKTTLVKHFNGLLKPTKGRVLVKNIDTRSATTAQLAKIVGYVFQNPNHQIFSNTVFEEVAFGPRNLGLERIKERVESSLEAVDMLKLIDKPPFLLSMGEKERLAIASLLSMEPSVLILDEPTTGQDYTTCSKIIKIAKKLKEQGKTIVLISHDMEVIAECSDRVFLMQNGRIVKSGEPEKVFSDFKLLESLSLSPPQIVWIGRELALNPIPVSMENFLERFKDEVCKLH